MATKLFTVQEIKIRYRPRKLEHLPAITSSQACAEILLQFFNKDTIALQEEFIVLYLDRACNIIGVHCLSYGGITGTVADIRLILGVALKAACTQLIMAHNHPSGNLQPSSADKELTRKVKEAGTFMDIKVLDHIIITPSRRYTSFADEGLL